MSKKHFIVKSGDENAGFTAYIKFALNSILYAEQHDLIPVINFDNSIRNFFYEESDISSPLPPGHAARYQLPPRYAACP